MAVKADFTTDKAVFSGEDQTLEFTVWDFDSGERKDITGWAIEFRLAQTQSGTSLITKNAVLTTPGAGVCRITLTAADLAAAAGVYFYSLTRIDVGNIQVLAYGSFVVQGRPN